MLTTLYLTRRRKAKQSKVALIVPRSDPLFLLISTIPRTLSPSLVSLVFGLRQHVLRGYLSRVGVRLLLRLVHADRVAPLHTIPPLGISPTALAVFALLGEMRVTSVAAPHTCVCAHVRTSTSLYIHIHVCVAMFLCLARLYHVFDAFDMHIPYYGASGRATRAHGRWHSKSMCGLRMKKLGAAHFRGIRRAH